MSVSQLSKWLGIFLFLILPVFLFSQKNIKTTSGERCHTDQKMQSAMDADPAYKKAMENDLVSPPISKFNNFGENSSVVVTIPVHVIIVHPPGQSVGTGVNFPLNHVESQITVLNEDFRRTNADAGNTPSVFPAADVEIEFCLASVDPSGNPTDGITRYGTNQNLNNNENAIKSATGWDRDDYLNIWVGPNLGGILGWAYLPGTNTLPNSTLDGVVTASTTFGGPGFGTNVPYHLGRTTTHEVGHYLGLRHVWGSGGCSNDDGIADTPIQSSSNFGCPSHPSPSCNNGGDMFMNYMDYVNDNCMNAFTADQGTRMQQILNNSRSSLLGSAAIVCSAGAPLVLQLVDQTNPTCNGGNDGTITILGSGGTGNYTYNINSGTPQINNVFTGLTAGTYEVEVGDGSSTISINVTLTEPTEVIPLISTQTDVSCFGENDGIIIVDGAGGTNFGSGYTYSIDNGPFTTNNFFTNLVGGVYTIIVRDELNCEGMTSVFINEPSELISFVASEISIDCNGSNTGQVVIGSTGGTPNFLYSFDGGAYSNNNVFTNLSQGVYTVATVDLNNCQHSFDVTVVEPNAIQFAVSSQTNLNCYGDENGIIEVDGQGGTGNLEYQINGQGYQSSNQFSNLSGGTYNLDVSDENGCVESLSVTITEPAELLVELTNQSNVPCFGGNTGSVTINTTGGSGTSSIIFDGTTATSNPVTFENLSAGIYPILVTDENDCTVSSTVEITENPEITLAITSTQNILCNGENNGSITAQSIGGSGSFTYFLNAVSQGSNNTFTNLSSGTYIIESIDDAGCSGIETVQITEPAVLEAQILQQTNLNCFGENNGSIVVNGTGGTGTLQYTLGNETNATGEFNNLSAGNFTIAILDENNCVTSVQAILTQPDELISSIGSQQNIDCFGENDGSVTINSSGGTGTISVDLNGSVQIGNAVTFENLSAGTYPVIVIDENNCQVNSTVEITENPAVELTILNSQNINCNGEGNGQIEVQANGGVGNFTYFLNGVTQGNNSIFTNLSSGSYLIGITDGVGCDDAMTVEITEPSILNVQLTQQTNLDCFGENNGTVTVSASGGNGTIEYTLGGTTNTTGEFNNLSAGNYQVMILDENNCSEIVDFEITQPMEVQVQVVQNTNVDCFGAASGSYEISASGGAGNFEFSNGTETNTTGVFNNLTAGNYTISVTDENSCVSTIQSNITQPAELITNILSQQDVNCFGENSGMISLESNGGIGNITFTLNGDSNTTGEFLNLSAGNYAIQVVDENNCETTVDFQIDEPTELNIVLVNINQASCSGQEGAIEVSANGGVGDYEFSVGGTTNTTGVFNGFSGGIYIV
ncbi:MAG: M43 family zinc metalloprotease, partial [Saprospiraceae bacterium]